MPGKLEDYRKERSFDDSPEPRGGAGDGDGPRFVIQEHDASTHHFDFRLEVEGVLKSWAVPKGPSTDPSERRLAVPTEDHPLAYADFEGVIPEGEYGAGTVLVWDAGRYRNLGEDEDGEPVPMTRQLRDGHAVFWLEGEKVSGGYALTRMGNGTDTDWLLVKMDDERADARRNPTSTEPESVKTGRTLAEIGADPEEGGSEDGE